MCVCGVFMCVCMSLVWKGREGGRVREGGEMKYVLTTGLCGRPSMLVRRQEKSRMERQRLWAETRMKERIQRKLWGTVGLPPRFPCFSTGFWFMSAQRVRDHQESMSGLDVQEGEGSGGGFGVEHLTHRQSGYRDTGKLPSNGCFIYSLLEGHGPSSRAGSLGQKAGNRALSAALNPIASSCHPTETARPTPHGDGSEDPPPSSNNCSSKELFFMAHHIKVLPKHFICSSCKVGL